MAVEEASTPKLGELSVLELIESARAELRALEERLGKTGRPVRDEDGEFDWVVLYLTSVQARLIVAGSKVRLSEETRAEIKAALEGDSNDAEHDALVSVAQELGVEYDPEAQV